MSECPYDADYYLRGKETGKSLYENYHWMPNLTIPMAQRIVNHLHIHKDQVILDYGCSRGYLVKALREIGHKAIGIDCSPWAIENADPDVRGMVKVGTRAVAADWIIAKDVLEHVTYEQGLPNVIDDLMQNARAGVFVVVPLGDGAVIGGQKYVIPEYELDVTHVHRFMLDQWVWLFLRPGWSVTASYSVAGIKENWLKPGWEKGNGFITARRG